LLHNAGVRELDIGGLPLKFIHGCRCAFRQDKKKLIARIS